MPVHMMAAAGLIAARVGTLGIQYRCSLENEFTDRSAYGMLDG